MGLTAGTCAPYLMRIVNKLDPAKPPTPNFAAAHTRVTWRYPWRQVPQSILTTSTSGSHDAVGAVEAGRAFT